LTTTLADREKIHQRPGTPAFAAPEAFHHPSPAMCRCPEVKTKGKDARFVKTERGQFAANA
jgi:hypothetical protein